MEDDKRLLKVQDVVVCCYIVTITEGMHCANQTLLCDIQLPVMHETCVDCLFGDDGREFNANCKAV